ncbi:hypothetical protein ANN_16883 [Periplaneta americana]|uniref:Uncharacterized protein n=1 Tax=Periplaneta americana TaxID=6978 RepID=A0ABQ8SRD1_PERAM|nr:hypothetical protein ANN_16883 [Periplaneta americana]
MAGLCEGGNEPPSSLKANAMDNNSVINDSSFDFIITKIDTRGKTIDILIYKTECGYVFSSYSHCNNEYCRAKMYNSAAERTGTASNSNKITGLESKEMEHVESSYNSGNHSLKKY